MDYKNHKISFRVWGRQALFTDPVTKIGGEKFSYQVPTYEAIKGIVKSIYWKPTLIWHIDRIRVMKPIHTQSKSTTSGLERRQHFGYLHLFARRGIPSGSPF